MHGHHFKQEELQQLQAKIVLLKRLNNVPVSPSRNSALEPYLAELHTDMRVLSFDKEKEVTEAFAFLASTTDDPGKIIALGIEEGPDRHSLNVVLAVNNGQINNVRQGFRKIADTLQAVAAKGELHRRDEFAVLEQAVSLNQNRILCRLRSQHGISKGKNSGGMASRPQLICTLRKVASLTGKDGTDLNTAKGFQTHVHKLDSLFGRLESISKKDANSAEGAEILLQLIRVFQQIRSSDSLKPALMLTDYNEERKQYLSRTVKKLASYGSTAEFLVRLAAKKSIFASIDITLVKATAMEMKPIVEANRFIAGLFTDVYGSSQAPSAVPKLKTCLKQQQKQQQQLDYPAFCRAVSSTRFVVHAEIQLVAYYESHRAAFPPRVLCSSKKACFLCNLFVNLHGKFFMPSTHGRIYDTWTIPIKLQVPHHSEVGGLTSTFRQFSTAISEKINDETRSPSNRFRHPNETLIFPTPVASEVLGRDPTPEPPVDSGYEGDDRKSCSPVPPERPHVASALAVSVTTLKESSDHETEREVISPPLPIAEPEQAPLPDPSCYTKLRRGEVFTFELSPTTRLTKVSTPRIHLTFSHAIWSTIETPAPDSQSSISGRDGCITHLTWLRESDVLHPGLPVLDYDNLLPGSETMLDRYAGSCNLYVRRRSDVVFVETVYGGAFPQNDVSG